MKEEIEISWNHHSQISPAELTCVLKELGDLLPDPLSERVFLPDYAQKLLGNAYIVYAKASEEIIGLVAIYANDQVNRISHIPFVSVSQKHQHQGIGRLLMKQAINLAKDKGMIKIWLNVHEKNTAAQRFYESIGFTPTEIVASKIKYEILLVKE